MIIGEILARNARMYGEETALIERDPAKSKRVAITWKQFDETANRIANALLKRGIRKGDKVIHLMMNCLEWLPVYFGILRTGAWAVPLNFRFSGDDILLCAGIAEAKAMFFGEEFIERIDAIRDDLSTIRHFIFIGPENSRPPYAESLENFTGSMSDVNPDVPISVLDEAALYFTSGTTGTPKPILITHRNLEFACIIENRHHNQTHEDNFLCIPPLYHTGAKMHWFGNFIVGAKAVILKGVKPQWILEAVSEEAVTIVWLLVPWAQDILVALETGELDLPKYKIDQWRLMHIGAQPVPPSLIKNWKKVFPGHDYDTNYGLSESTGPGCVHLGIENIHKVGAIGVPGFDWECRIVDRSLKNVPRGEPGELMVKGPCVMKEYYKNPKATSETLFDGWLLTGDMARVDEDGFIWLVDRKKDVIITGGENIFPVEIEDFLMDNPKLQDAAVIGLPDERLGEIVAAIIKVKPGQTMDEKELLAFCDKLPRYKRPRKVFFDDVPRNPTGKIEKPKLRKKYSGMEESFKI
ncbi:MAG: AMP-dependent synthetase [Deltaproteobacteria bacterium CG_4_8_14_3_um_filter_51_11]|nr:AMP-binding protein [bacterium]OIP43079.1 MAG: AMP-dependent synthetase [Desulfobacteraceae bacterium CG2_30_51_40]PIP46474.1 MAG: AMP-dependent synthetase [Deltaproteobacteria bacterium CG23_combo_of_CG06-09_8_20_14_all_51_20]PIV98604.1 MAG: AMP-dependent synthetase [Deltaproteobacteria bacterium CG17_big_fil_post_rev_8_21_14_2_50_51_6]PIX20149.1 MAG: AMP-dependent synthetase [Deltaproteobacteria bacterium CG_4_8_14_3_um_filter_51_11]PIY26483.1 MAG: AMP-dependent synthetase [Deltaproteobac